MFGSIEEIGSKSKKGASTPTENGHLDVLPDGAAQEVVVPVAYLVMGCVIVRHHPSGEVELEWEGNLMNDSVADAVLSVLFMMESSPAAIKRE